MTNQNRPDAPQLSRAGFDFFTRQIAQEAIAPGASSGPQFKTFELPQSERAIGFQFTISNLQGGLNRTRGDYDRDYDRIAKSTSETRAYRHAGLPSLLSIATTPDPTGGLTISHVNIFGTHMLAVGSGANVSLYSETSTTDPTLVAVTYTPTGNITGLAPAVLGGDTQDLRLLVMRDGANDTQLIGDASGTVDGTLSGLNPPVWGAIQTPLNNNTIVFYNNGGLNGLQQGGAITATEVALLQGVHNGGYALGIIGLGQGPLRLWWVWPKDADLTASMLTLGSESAGEVWSTNMEGFDPQPLDMGLVNVFLSALGRNGIAASDGIRITFHDGRVLKDLGLLRDRVLNSNREIRVRSLYFHAGELYCVLNERATPNGTGNTKVWVETYNFTYGTWHQVSTETTLSTTGNLTVAAAGSGVVSDATGFLHHRTDGSWYRQFTPPFGIPLHTLRQTSGAEATTGQQFETSSMVRTPNFTLPGLMPYKKLITHIYAGGDYDAGGPSSSVEYVVGDTLDSAGNLRGVKMRATPKGQLRPQMQAFPNNQDLIYEPALQINITQGTNTRMTPNVLPVSVFGVAFLDEYQQREDPLGNR